METDEWNTKKMLMHMKEMIHLNEVLESLKREKEEGSGMLLAEYLSDR